MLKCCLWQPLVDRCDHQVWKASTLLWFLCYFFSNCWYRWNLFFLRLFLFTAFCCVNGKRFCLFPVTDLVLVRRSILFFRNYFLHAEQLFFQFSNRALPCITWTVGISIVSKGFFLVRCLKGSLKKHTAWILFSQGSRSRIFGSFIKWIRFCLRPEKRIIDILPVCIEFSFLVCKLQSQSLIDFFMGTVFFILSCKINGFGLVAFLIRAKVRNYPLIVEGLSFRIIDVHSFRLLNILEFFFVGQRRKVFLIGRVFKHELVFFVGGYLWSIEVNLFEWRHGALLDAFEWHFSIGGLAEEVFPEGWFVRREVIVMWLFLSNDWFAYFFELGRLHGWDFNS